MRPDAVPDPPVRPASTVIVLRPGPSAFDVLTVRRGGSAAFMNNARVFPGGALGDVDRGDLAAAVVKWSGSPDERAWRSAALRELAEEAGVFISTEPGVAAAGTDEVLYRSLNESAACLDADRLVYLSNWVTPKGPPRRFDTRFFITVVPATTEAAADRVEVFDAEWTSPGEALERADRGDWVIEFPTRRHLELLAGFHEPQDVLNYAQAQEPVPRVEPRILTGGDGSWTVVLPGQPGYEEAMQ